MSAHPLAVRQMTPFPAKWEGSHASPMLIVDLEAELDLPRSL
jgi:hypothetical protein